MNCIQYGNKKIDFEIKRGNRKKTVAIHVNIPTVTVLAPKRLDEEKIRMIIQKKARWIIEKQELMERNKYLNPAKEFVSGESFLYLGRQYRLKVIKSAAGEAEKCKLINGRLRVEIDRNLDGEKGKRTVEKALTAWYLEHAEGKIRERTGRFAKQLGRLPKSVEVKNHKARWGSCSQTGAIRFNWRIIMMPLSVLDYVIVHELCHLTYLHHSVKFWQEVQSIIPDYKKKRDKLKAFSFQINAWG